MKALTFSPEKVISMDEFAAIFNIQEGVELGEVVTPPLFAFRMFMKQWVSRMDGFIVEARKRQLVSLLVVLERYRACSYEEFTLLFNNVQEEKFKHYPVFQFLNIPSMDYLLEYRLNLQENVQSYFQVLLEATQDMDGHGIDFFLRGLKSTVSLLELKRHGYICGATGSGKSELMRLLMHRIVEEYAHTRHSIVLIDPHGDLSQQLKTSKLYAQNENFIYFEPELIAGYTPVINPLEIDTSDEKKVVIHAQNLAKAIEEAVGTDLTVNMGTLLIPCLTLLLLRKDSTLLDLVKLMQDDPDLIAEGKQLANEAHRLIFTNFKDKHYAKTKASIFTRLQSFLNYPAFYYATVGKSTIDVRHAINTGKMIVFNLSDKHFGTDASAAYGRFIISIIKSTVKMRGKIRTPTFLFVDECQEFISPSIKDILQQTRKYGLHIIMANQSVESLDSIENVVLGNTSVKLIGRNDSIQSRKKMASITGEDVHLFHALRNYHFYLKTSAGNGHIFAASDALITDTSLSITAREEKEFDEHIVKQYYTATTNTIPALEDESGNTKYDI